MPLELALDAADFELLFVVPDLWFKNVIIENIQSNVIAKQMEDKSVPVFYLLVGVVLLGESAGPDRDDWPLGVLVPDDFVFDEAALDLPADFSCEEDALSVFVVLGLRRETKVRKSN